MAEIILEKGLSEDSHAREIRTEVFIKEQQFQDEFDEIDLYATHAIKYMNNIPAATGRVFRKNQEALDDTTYIIGRVAVIKEYRSYHLGSEIINALEDYARKKGAQQIELSAQVRVRKFYEKLGYKGVGDIYLDEHTEHILMIKQL